MIGIDEDRSPTGKLRILFYCPEREKSRAFPDQEGARPFLIVTIANHRFLDGAVKANLDLSFHNLKYLKK